MKELPGGTGGKSVLLKTFREFRRKGVLSSSAFGKKMACVFIADKDSDDFAGIRLRSNHLIYSPTYDLEGHLFSCGDLHRALADSCGITAQQAQTLVPNPFAWLNKVASDWKEWIALCLISQKFKVNCGCTFDRFSQVNPDPLAPPDQNQVTAFKAALAAKLKLNAIDFDELFLGAVKRVNKSITSAAPLKYFKGKWLGHLMQRHLEGLPRIPEANINGVGERLGVALVGQVAALQNCRCCAPYLPGLAVVTAIL